MLIMLKKLSKLSSLTITVSTLIFVVLIWVYVKLSLPHSFYTLDSNKPGPTILIVAGTHGNEPAASTYFTNLIKSKYIPESGKMIIIPRVNNCALKINMRSVPLIGDINRKYYIDFMIFQEGEIRLIEIKSSYYYNLYKDEIDAKASAASIYSENQGYLPFCLIIDNICIP